MDTTVNTLRIEIGASTDEAKRKIDEVAKSLRNLKGQMKQNTLTQRIKVDTKDVDKAHKKVGALTNIMNSLKRIAFYRIIRSAIKAVGEAFSEGAERAYWYSKTLGDQTKYIADAYDTLASKSFTMTNQLGASWATLKATITPILIEIVNLVTAAASALTQLFAVLGGKSTFLKATDYAKDWADATASGAASAKEWRNQIMGFDEINRLEKPAEGGRGGGSNKPTDYENMFQEMPVNDYLKRTVDLIKSHLTELELFAAGAALAVGLLLTVSGANVPLGLGLIAAGAYGIGRIAYENWGYLTSNLNNALDAIMIVAAGATFGIGAVLAFSGANVPLGLGLMAGGLLAMANYAALKWDDMPKKVKWVLAAIDAVLSLSAIAVGAVMAFSGFNVPLGIALMAGGFAGLGVAAKLAWDDIPQNIKETIAEITMILGAGLFSLGAILAFSGVNIPVGLGLMAVGLASFAGAAKLSWGSLSDEIKKEINAIMLTLATGLVAIGAILAFSGVNIPLGIGLMAAGALLTGSFVALNWNIIKEKLEKPVNDVLTMIAGASLVLGILLLLTGNFPLGLGLIAAGASGLVGAAVANWDNLKKIGEDAVASVKEGWDAAIGAGVEFVAKVKNDAETWWSDVQKWWGEKVGNVQEFKTNAANKSAEWWSNVKIWWADKVGYVDEFLAQVQDDSATWWSNVTEWWATASADPVTFAAQIVNNIATLWSNVKGWWDSVTAGGLWTTLGIHLPTISVEWRDWFSVFGQNIQYPVFTVSWGDEIEAFAAGGFPEDGLFMANHGELVGKFSNGKTAVANNEQIIEGIREAVFDAFTAAMSVSGGNDNKEVVINLDGHEIARTTTRYQRQFARASG